MIYNRIIGKEFYFKTITCIIALIFFNFIVSFKVLADSYTTVANGNWNATTTWLDGDIAPTNINYSDQVLINTTVNAEDLKINNGGTMIVNDQLNAKEITLNGPDSRLIVERGAILNVQNIQGNSQNIVYKGTPGALPVTLISFALKSNNKTRETNILTWQTAQEINNAFFAIESSQDGKTFTERGTVTGKNTTAGAAYSYEDITTAAKTYYRLKQVDFDGNVAYSPIIVAAKNQKLHLNGNTISFGNPVQGEITLYNSAGRQVIKTALDQISTLALPEDLKGIFILEAEIQNQVTVQRIML